jgi:hypothetical protein
MLIREIIKQPGLSRTELPVIVREENVTLDEFNLMYSKGLSKVLKEKIFKGGLTIEARPIAWKRILGLIDDQHINTDMKDDYVKLRLQWENLTPDQEKLCSILRERRALIGKDIIRTEPGRLTDPEIERLKVLLTTYAVFDQDLGYVQGMSDIAVVILDIYPDDNDAFWVYVRLMQRIRGNFEKSQQVIKLQEIVI